MKLDKPQKDVISKYLLETYKFNLGGLVVGYILAPEKLHPFTLSAGLFFSLICFILSVYLAKEVKS